MVLEEELRAARVQVETRVSEAALRQQALERQLHQLRRELEQKEQRAAKAEEAEAAAAAALAMAEARPPPADPVPWESAVGGLLDLCAQGACELELMLELQEAAASAAQHAEAKAGELKRAALRAELDEETHRRERAEG